MRASQARILIMCGAQGFWLLPSGSVRDQALASRAGLGRRVMAIAKFGADGTWPIILQFVTLYCSGVVDISP